MQLNKCYGCEYCYVRKYPSGIWHAYCTWLKENGAVEPGRINKHRLVSIDRIKKCYKIDKEIKL